MQIQGTSRWLVATLLILGACSTSSTATTAALPTTVPTVPITTTTFLATTTTLSPATTTTTEALEILLPNNDVEDPVEAIVAILEYVSYLARTPQNARDFLDLVYAETCECYERLLADFDTYVANGWAQDDDGIVVTGAIVTQKFTDSVLLEVTYSYAPQFVITSDNRRLRVEADEWTNRVSLIGLEFGSDGRWRVGVIGIVGDNS
jgi:hypothetical protein